MRKIWAIGLSAVVCAGCATIVLLRLNPHADATGPLYTTAPIERGDVVSSITSTGTIEPVSTVNVGTQVSGIINRIYVDFNDTVTKGQIIAELDRTVLSGMLDEAIAALDRAKAFFDLAQAEFRRNEPLYKKGFLAEQEFIKLRADFLTQQATLRSAEASVKKARTNLGYATITSPITGTVIQRSIEAGQTVAANFSAPTLFVIAEDLRRMEILASVDEADIGAIRKGQEVCYAVQAFTDKRFSGVVEQVRLQPTISQNVVTYTVVISTENSDGTLLPGMTATVDFIIEKATDVLLAPNAALRFTPTDASAPMPGTGNRQKMHGMRGDRAASKGQPSIMPSSIRKLESAGRPHRKESVVWLYSENNPPRPARVEPGVTDGKMTELRHAGDLKEGVVVITGTKTAQKQKTKTVSLLPQPGPPGRRR